MIDDAPKCGACGVPFRNHLGLQGMCMALEEAKKLIRTQVEAIEKLEKRVAELEAKSEPLLKVVT